jgi:hypothetical protein
MKVHGYANSVLVLVGGITVNALFGNILPGTFTSELSYHHLSSNLNHFTDHSSNYFFFLP